MEDVRPSIYERWDLLPCPFGCTCRGASRRPELLSSAACSTPDQAMVKSSWTPTLLSSNVPSGRRQKCRRRADGVFTCKLARHARAPSSTRMRCSCCRPHPPATRAPHSPRGLRRDPSTRRRRPRRPCVATRPSSVLAATAGSWALSYRPVSHSCESSELIRSRARRSCCLSSRSDHNSSRIAWAASSSALSARCSAICCW